MWLLHVSSFRFAAKAVHVLRRANLKLELPDRYGSHPFSKNLPLVEPAQSSTQKARRNRRIIIRRQEAASSSRGMPAASRSVFKSANVPARVVGRPVRYPYGNQIPLGSILHPRAVGGEQQRGASGSRSRCIFCRFVREFPERRRPGLDRTQIHMDRELDHHIDIRRHVGAWHSLAQNQGGKPVLHCPRAVRNELQRVFVPGAATRCFAIRR